jgi:NADPH2:quinone reductase
MEMAAEKLVSHAIRSTIRADGRLTLSLEEDHLPQPGDDEVIIRVEAAPINPADLLLMFYSVDPRGLEAAGTAKRPAVVGKIAANRLAGAVARIDRALAVGNEGAGRVVQAGAHAQSLVGRTVSMRDAMYAQYRLAKVSDCFVLPEGTSAREGAAASINPMTALGMVETMRREGHSALVHTAAASNLGQMLLRLCQADGIPLVNIVRRAEQVTLLRELGAEHVVNSSAPDFPAQLINLLQQTSATLAFDAIGGGTTAATILECMEAALTTSGPFSRYGSPVHKQVYVYGGLDPTPKIIQGNLGMAWGIGGWLMSWFLKKIGPKDAQALQARIAAELTTTFACSYVEEISLAEALDPEIIASYSRNATGGKYLILPNATAAPRRQRSAQL